MDIQLKRDYRSLNRVRPVVTVGLCVRNSEATIREAVNSVVVQDFSHELMEIIFVDDGSEDATLKIIEDCVSKIDIKTRIFHTNWRGLGSARNLVVNNANGDYIIWVDGDMFLSKDYVEQQVKFMEQNSSAGIVGGCFGICPEENWVAALENISYVVSRLRQSGKSTSSMLGAGGSIFRVKAIREVGGFNCNIKGAYEDIDIAHRIRSAGYSFHVTNALFYHKQKRTWKNLWKSNFWYGYGLHFFLHEKQGLSVFRDRSEEGLPLFFLAYKLTRRKVVFLLPLNFVFKKIAVIFGFLEAHWDGYGHN